MNPQAMMEMLDNYGIANRRWPDDTLKQLEAAWLEVVAEESANDPMFKRIAESFYGFREPWRVWGEALAFKSTYRKVPPR